MPYFGVGVYPSMNPSRVQLRRYTILGSLVTPIPKHSLIFCIVCMRAACISSSPSNGILAADYSNNRKRAVDLPTIHMIKTCLAGAAASVAMDGVAPESRQDDPLREEQH